MKLLKTVNGQVINHRYQSCSGQRGNQKIILKAASGQEINHKISVRGQEIG